MIVRTFDDAIQLITQPEHAHLAGAIMTCSVPLKARARHTSILHAVTEHDNGWEEVDAAPMVDTQTGEVVDFIRAPVNVRHGVWPRAVARLRDDRWAAALVAQHAITAYDRFRKDPEWSTFFAGMEKARDQMLGADGGSLDDLLPDYAFVRLGDLISLAFCTATSEQLRFGDWSVRLAGTRVLVTPDAFGGAEIPIEITARALPKRPFRSDADLSDALKQATPITLQGSVVGA